MLLKTNNYFLNFKIWQQKSPSKSGFKKIKITSCPKFAYKKRGGADNTKSTISLLLFVFFLFHQLFDTVAVVIIDKRI
jgi:hypothetical protein